MSFVAQTVAEILSENISECRCRSFIRCSSAICWRRMAASSKSLMVRVPATKACWTSGGNWILQTVGGKRWDTQNPPIPPLAASSMPTADGVNCTNSRTWVGRRSKSLSSSRMSLIAPWRSNVFLVILVAARLVCRALKKGVMSPFAAGAIRVALMSLPVSFSNRWRLIRGWRSRRRSSAQMGSLLVAGSFHVLALPLPSNPKISLRVMSFASPFSSFFLEMGSFPPVCPVIMGGGKMEWIP